jgi:hypothetical protein
MSKDFRTAAIAASIAIGTPSVLLAPATNAAVSAANDAISTAVEAQLVSSANPDRTALQAREKLLAALSAMDPQQKSELANERVPAPDVWRVHELEAAVRCICTGCCTTDAGVKGRSPAQANPPKVQPPSNLTAPKIQSPSNLSAPKTGVHQ